MAKKIKTKCRFRSLEDLRWLLVRSTLAIVFCHVLLAITCLTLLFLVRYGQHLQPINFL
jgi:hypothetical protein